MNGTEKLLWRFLEGSGKRFVIPVYQRNYDWKTEHCKQLYDDLVNTIKSGRKRHFFGSIVSVYNSQGQNDEFLIIDGQQRITTVSLLLLSMYNLLDKGIVASEKSVLTQQIHDDFLVDKWQPEDKRVKLKPVKDDQKAFASLFGEEDDYVKTSGVIANYNYFYDRILKHELMIDQLFDAICRLEIIDIKLTPPDDDPQLIFESLNSTGLDLSEGDKIRNFVLMGLPSDSQERYYNSYWNKIEEQTGYDVSSFVRDYLTVKQGKIPTIKKVYASFKEYVEINKIGTEEILIDLLKYARHYNKLVYGKTGIVALDDCIFRLNRLETSVTYPYFLEVFEANSNNLFDSNILTSIFLTIESYIFRRIICDLPSNSLNKVFISLHRDIMRITKDNVSYLEKLRYILLAKQGKTRFPDDSSFTKALSEKDIYNMPNKNKWYLFERLENRTSAERIEVYKMLDDGDLSVEHIMPQTLTNEWMNSLGDDYARIHREWLHRLANMTLTAYNSKYSNNSFVQKRDMKDGYRDSGLRLNQELISFDKWTEDELTQRQKALINTATLLWPQYQSDYVPEEETNDTYSLDDDVDFTGKKITEFMLFEQTQKVSSWTEFYKKVLIILHEKDETILNKLVLNQMNSDLTAHVEQTDSSFRASVQIDDNIFVWSNTNTQSKLNCLLKFFKLYDTEPSELIFTVQNTQNTESDESEQNNRYDTRLRFWELLLNEHRKSSQLFSNVNPHKDNWLSATAGIASGIQYSFIIGKRYCAVQIEFYTGSKEKNKSYFDKMIEKKNEIETTFGSSLIWERKDDAQHSKIRAINTDSNIYNEETWPEICSFMVNNMNRLYDAVQPILREVQL